jgi:DNA-binding transcriptional LysR family regulator
MRPMPFAWLRWPALAYCQVPYLTVQDDVEAGRLVPVLEAFELKGVGVYVVYAERRHMTQKQRAFIDFMAEQLCQPWC